MLSVRWLLLILILFSNEATEVSLVQSLKDHCKGNLGETLIGPKYLNVRCG